MAKLYYDSDADLGMLKGKTIAVIGYGSQGRAQAQNLHDSGVDVVVGARKDGMSWKKASSDGLKVANIDEACEKADIIFVLIPDDQQVEVYKKHILPNLKKGNALYFSHGFNIHYYQIEPPENVDVIMIAPKSPGDLVRRMYVGSYRSRPAWGWLNLICHGVNPADHRTLVGQPFGGLPAGSGPNAVLFPIRPVLAITCPDQDRIPFLELGTLSSEGAL